MVNIKKCRICKSNDLSNTINLGNLSLSGKFFKNQNLVPKRKLSLVICNNCGLNQILQVYDLSILYDMNYGYQSSQNKSMYNHLLKKAKKLKTKLKISKNDIVIDIGSNDATTLSFFKENKLKIGIDGIAKKFKNNYKKINALAINDFFPSKKLDKILLNKKAKLISAYSCFYDLPDPVKFARGIEKILSEDGIWSIEQSYFPSMLDANSFDTICHEHIEYYRLTDIDNICKKSNLKIIDVQFNDINGGSFAVNISHKNSKFKISKNVKQTLKKESKVNWKLELKKFVNRIEKQKKITTDFLNKQVKNKKIVLGIGASTKGSILLQYYKISNRQIRFIGEVNREKFNCRTPGTNIEIISEDKILNLKPDFLFIFTWHFKEFFIKNKKFKNTNLIFPLPKFHIVKN